MNEYEPTDDQAVCMRAEQATIGAILANNDMLDLVAHLQSSHFYRNDHRLVYDEILRQIAKGQRADALTVSEQLAGQVEECLPYLAKLRHAACGGYLVRQHADIVIDRAKKRALAALGSEIMSLAETHQDADSVIDLVAARLEELGRAQVDHEPCRMDSMMTAYLDTVTARYEGRIIPIATGWRDLDDRLDGGLERGTLTVVAGRPSMGKTAFGLGLARNVAIDAPSLFLSMEMQRDQVNDRNIAGLGHVPLSWLKRPAIGGDNPVNWDAVTVALNKSQQLQLYIDDQAGLNMLQIRAKARRVKRQAGALAALVIDQLSFITGSRAEKSYESVGEYTRALVALAKELDIAIVLLCQLNRKCEERGDKRPMLSDLALSGSIEQDAANILFLYRDEVYNPQTQDAGVCEVIAAKLRQGAPGITALTYIGAQTRFESMARPWHPQVKTMKKPTHNGFE